MKLHIFILLIPFIFLSCDKEDSIKEKFILDDGTIICCDNTVKHYASEDSFINTMSEDYPQKRNYKQEYANQQIMNMQKDSLYGEGKIDLYNWEKASFGTWIEAYGLQKGKIYLVARAAVYQYVPANGLQVIVASKYTPNEYDSIGFMPNSINKGFHVTHSNTAGFIECCTILKYIKCDVEKNIVDWFYPISDTKKLKWKYTIVSLNNN